MNEIKESHVDSAELSKNKESIQTIVASIKDFEPHILLHGKRPIYWDLKSYLHVVLRHAKKLQMGTFKSKSPFPYRLEDLETLIEKVLGQIEGEIQRHFSERPGNKFRRSGRMCVPFNGDYYCLYIDENGKLETIYAR